MRTQKNIEAAETDAGRRIDLVVRDLTTLSREQVTGLFDHYCVQLNGAVCTTPGERLNPGDRVAVEYDSHRRYHAKPKPPRNLGFEIVFEDSHLIVVNKPPALLTVPTPYREENTLISRISAYLSHSSRDREAYCAHRLDRGVSGLLVFGKSLEVSLKLRDQFELRKPQREYVALVRGIVADEEGTFRSYLATDANLNRYSTPEEGSGQLAITHYRVISPLDDATLVQIWLETGRRNQIRVHFAERGHPVLGDRRYESVLAQHPRWNAPRIALHARSLGFTHPINEQPYRFECELPREMTKFIAGGRKK